MEPLTIDVVDSDGGFRVNHVPLEDRRLAYEHRSSTPRDFLRSNR